MMFWDFQTQIFMQWAIMAHLSIMIMMVANGRNSNQENTDISTLSIDADSSNKALLSNDNITFK